jgi:hypothetical protein
VGRHVLLELGCQNAERRFWWDFTVGQVTCDGRTPAAGAPPPRPAEKERSKAREREPELTLAGALANGQANGHANGASVATVEVTPSAELEAVTGGPALPPEPEPVPASAVVERTSSDPELVAASVVLETDVAAVTGEAVIQAVAASGVEVPPTEPRVADATPSPATADLRPFQPLPLPAEPDPSDLRERFLRQLDLDRLTLRQMRTWVLAEDGRRAAEVAASATEAAYERLALALFGANLSVLRGETAPTAPAADLTAAERLDQQREKARIRARLRRAQIKAAKLASAPHDED